MENKMPIYKHYSENFTQYDAQLLCRIQSLTYKVTGFTFDNYDLKFISDEILTELKIYSDIHNDFVTTHDVIQKFLSIICNCTHPSATSGYLAYGKQYLSKILASALDSNDTYIKNLTTYYDDFMMLCSVCDYSYALVPRQLTNTNKFLHHIDIINGIDSQLCGSFVECCVAEALHATYDWDDARQLLMNMYAKDYNKFSDLITFAKEYVIVPKDYFDLDIVEHLTTDTKTYYQNDNVRILWKAFIHYIERNDYIDRYSSFIKIMKYVYKHFDIYAYINTLKMDLNIPESHMFKHNIQYPLQKIIIDKSVTLNTAGECDIYNATTKTIYDVKCYKNVSNVELNKWFYQTLIYTFLNNGNSDINNVKTLVIELKHNNLYTFTNITHGKLTNDIQKLYKSVTNIDADTNINVDVDINEEDCPEIV